MCRRSANKAKQEAAALAQWQMAAKQDAEQVSAPLEKKFVDDYLLNMFISAKRTNERVTFVL